MENPPVERQLGKKANNMHINEQTFETTAKPRDDSIQHATGLRSGTSDGAVRRGAARRPIDIFQLVKRVFSKNFRDRVFQ